MGSHGGLGRAPFGHACRPPHAGQGLGIAALTGDSESLPKARACNRSPANLQYRRAIGHNAWSLNKGACVRSEIYLREYFDTADSPQGVALRHSFRDASAAMKT